MSNNNIWLNEHSIQASISERYASVSYLFNFTYNGTVESKELQFEITIHPDSFISGFIADINGKIFTGKTKERSTAKKEYSLAKSKNENTILISQKNKNIPNVFEIKTNMSKNSKILLTITIEQYLKKKFNFNELNILILRQWQKYYIKTKYKYIAFDINISDKRGIYDIYIDTSNIYIDKNIMNKLKTNCCIQGQMMDKTTSLNELFIKYKIKGEQEESHILYDKNSKTFVHIISDLITDSIITQNDKYSLEGNDDKIEDNVLIPRRVMFLIDTSGSMSGNKWNQTVSATITALKRLRINHDRYGIMFFHSDIETFPEKGMIIANEDNIEKSILFIEIKQAGGGTNINMPLMQAIKTIKINMQRKRRGSFDTSSNDCQLAKEETSNAFFMNQIILITDGEPNRGETDTDQIILNVERENKLNDIDKYMQKIAIFSFGVGSDDNDSSWCDDLNHSFLKLLSVQNNGIYKRIKQSNCTTELNDYFEILSRPVLCNINVKYDNKNLKYLTDTQCDVLYSGNDIIICGKVNKSSDDEKEFNLTATISAIKAKEMKQNNGTSIVRPIQIDKKIKIDINCIQQKQMNIINNHPTPKAIDCMDEFESNNTERIWAYLKLQQFAKQKIIQNEEQKEEYIEIEKDENNNPLKLAMKYKFITPWTSMIVTEHQQTEQIKKSKQKPKQKQKRISQKMANAQHKLGSRLDAIFNPQSIELETRGIVEEGYFIQRAKQIEDGHRHSDEILCFSELDDNSDDSDAVPKTKPMKKSKKQRPAAMFAAIDDFDSSSDNNGGGFVSSDKGLLDDDDDDFGISDDDDDDDFGISAALTSETKKGSGGGKLRSDLTKLLDYRMFGDSDEDDFAPLKKQPKKEKRPEMNKVGTKIDVNKLRMGMSGPMTVAPKEEMEYKILHRPSGDELIAKQSSHKKNIMNRRPTMSDLETRGIVPSGYFDDVEQAMNEKHIRKENIIHDLSSRLKNRPAVSQMLAKGLITKPMEFKQSEDKDKLCETYEEKSLEVYDKNGIKIIFKINVIGGMKGVIRVMGVFYNASMDDIVCFNFMIAVPKYMKLQMKVANGTKLLKLSKNSITQRFQITNTKSDTNQFIMNIKVSFEQNGKLIRDIASVQIPNKYCV